MNAIITKKGPKHVPILGWRYRGLQMLKDPMKFFVDLNKTYGELCFWDPNHETEVTNKPNVIVPRTIHCVAIFCL